MIRPGLCSITLAKCSPDEIVALCREEGLSGIEWWGKDHVPPGDSATASRVGRLTRDAGLQVTSYGAYFRTGVSEREGQRFDTVLSTAKALGAPLIRIWSGSLGSAEAPEPYVRSIVEETLRIADLAAREEVTLGFEHHPNTLTDSNEAVVRFAELVRHPAVRFYWQPPRGSDEANCLAGLNAWKDRLANLHVFQWTLEPDADRPVPKTGEPPAKEKIRRHPLAAGAESWRRYLRCAADAPGDRWALLEFVADDALEQCRQDAKTLLSLLDRAACPSVVTPNTENIKT